MLESHYVENNRMEHKLRGITWQIKAIRIVRVKERSEALLPGAGYETQQAVLPQYRERIGSRKRLPKIVLYGGEG